MRLPRSRRCGFCYDSERHPLDVGADAVARYFKIEDQCAQAQRLKIMAAGKNQ
jgi:hypothetical protein